MTYPTPEDITAAAHLIQGRVRETPILDLEPAALGLDHPITLKLEHTQITGSFKVRGAFNNMLSRSVPAAGVVAASGGNHGAAVAYAGDAIGPCVKDLCPEIHRQRRKAAPDAFVWRRSRADRRIGCRLHDPICRGRRDNRRLIRTPL